MQIHMISVIWHIEMKSFYWFWCPSSLYKSQKTDWAYFRKSVFCTVNGNIYEIFLYYVCILGFIEMKNWFRQQHHVLQCFSSFVILFWCKPLEYWFEGLIKSIQNDQTAKPKFWIILPKILVCFDPHSYFVNYYLIRKVFLRG